MAPQRKRPAQRLFKGLAGGPDVQIGDVVVDEVVDTMPKEWVVPPPNPDLIEREPGAAQQPEQPEHIPHTKSLHHAAVPSTDPDAPLGRDDDGKPIVPMRTDQEIAAALSEKPFLAPGLCPHNNDPNNCTLCGTKGFSSSEIMSPAFKPDTPEQAAARLEQRARNFFGLPTPQPRHDFEIHTSKTTIRFDSYREILLLEQQHVADIFLCIVKYGRPVKPSEETIARLQKEIKALDDLIITRSAAWQKHHRPDDPLDKNDRERLKRQETKERDEKRAELRGLRAQLRRWEQTPQVPITFEDRYPITHRYVSSVEHGVFVPDKERRLVGQDPYHTEVVSTEEIYADGEYNIEGYRKFLRLGVEALAQVAEGLTGQGWKEWENLVIIQAIKCGLLKPAVEMVKTYHELAVYQPPPDDIVLDDTENTLIVKTGGASVYGRLRIHGAGFKGVANNTPRKLSDFNRPVVTKGGIEDGAEDGWNSGPQGDDSESYDPD